MIDLSMLKELCGLPGVSGRENAVRDYIISKIDGFADYETDNLGNLIVHKKGLKQAKAKLMIAAHMDEVGVVASHITDGGFIKFVTAGSIGPGVLLGRALIFESGARGVVGIKPVHLVDDADKDKLPKLENLYIDIGADSREEALKHVRIGDSAVFDSGFMEFGDNKIKSKALDDRVGCAIMISLIQSEIEYDTAFVFTVQEEVGLRGAGAAAFTVRPDCAIILEGTTAADIIGSKEHERVCVQAEGAAISFMDKATVYDRSLYDLAFETAKKNGIKAQPKTVVAGGNDAGVIHKAAGGAKTIAVNVPCRYIHSPSCVADKRDIESAFSLVKTLIKEIGKHDV